MPVSPRPELNGIIPCYHGGVRREEVEDIAGKTVIDFSVNTNPLGPSHKVSAAIAEIDVQRYPDDDATVLRAALSQRLSRGKRSFSDASGSPFHHDAPTIDNLIVANGSVELIWLACLAYISKGDSVLILGPTFGEYETASRIMGANVNFHIAEEKDDFRPRLDEVESAIERIRPKMIFLCNPNNPTGFCLSGEEIERVVSAAEVGLVVIDEAYASLADHYWVSEELVRWPNVLLLRSMTKDLALAGLRIGYALADVDVIKALKKVRPPWSANACAQAAAIAALQDEEHLTQSRLEIRAAKEYLLLGLTEIGLKVVPSKANFFLVKVGNVPFFRTELLMKGFCVRDCASFGLKEYIRIGIRTREECRGLVKAIREVLGVD